MVAVYFRTALLLALVAFAASSTVTVEKAGVRLGDTGGKEEPFVTDNVCFLDDAINKCDDHKDDWLEKIMDDALQVLSWTNGTRNEEIIKQVTAMLYEQGENLWNERDDSHTCNLLSSGKCKDHSNNILGQVKDQDRVKEMKGYRTACSDTKYPGYSSDREFMKTLLKEREKIPSSTTAASTTAAPSTTAVSTTVSPSTTFSTAPHKDLQYTLAEKRSGKALKETLLKKHQKRRRPSTRRLWGSRARANAFLEVKGKFLKKVGKGAKKVAKKVGKGAKKVGKKVKGAVIKGVASGAAKLLGTGAVQKVLPEKIQNILDRVEYIFENRCRLNFFNKIHRIGMDFIHYLRRVLSEDKTVNELETYVREKLAGKMMTHQKNSGVRSLHYALMRLWDLIFKGVANPEDFDINLCEASKGPVKYFLSEYMHGNLKKHMELFGILLDIEELRETKCDKGCQKAFLSEVGGVFHNASKKDLVLKVLGNHTFNDIPRPKFYEGSKRVATVSGELLTMRIAKLLVPALSRFVRSALGTEENEKGERVYKIDKLFRYYVNSPFLAFRMDKFFMALRNSRALFEEIKKKEKRLFKTNRDNLKDAVNRASEETGIKVSKSVENCFNHKELEKITKTIGEKFKRGALEAVNAFFAMTPEQFYVANFTRNKPEVAYTVLRLVTTGALIPQFRVVEAAHKFFDAVVTETRELEEELKNKRCALEEDMDKPVHTFLNEFAKVYGKVNGWEDGGIWNVQLKAEKAGQPPPTYTMPVPKIGAQVRAGNMEEGDEVFQTTSLSVFKLAHDFEDLFVEPKGTKIKVTQQGCLVRESVEQVVKTENSCPNVRLPEPNTFKYIAQREELKWKYIWNSDEVEDRFNGVNPLAALGGGANEISGWTTGGYAMKGFKCGKKCRGCTEADGWRFVNGKYSLKGYELDDADIPETDIYLAGRKVPWIRKQNWVSKLGRYIPLCQCEPKGTGTEEDTMANCHRPLTEEDYAKFSGELTPKEVDEMFKTIRPPKGSLYDGVTMACEASQAGGQVLGDGCYGGHFVVSGRPSDGGDSKCFVVKWDLEIDLKQMKREVAKRSCGMKEHSLNNPISTKCARQMLGTIFDLDQSGKDSFDQCPGQNTLEAHRSVPNFAPLEKDSCPEFVGSNPLQFKKKIEFGDRTYCELEPDSFDSWIDEKSSDDKQLDIGGKIDGILCNREERGKKYGSVYNQWRKRSGWGQSASWSAAYKQQRLTSGLPGMGAGKRSRSWGRRRPWGRRRKLLQNSHSHS